MQHPLDIDTCTTLATLLLFSSLLLHAKHLIDSSSFKQIKTPQPPKYCTDVVIPAFTADQAAAGRK